MNKKDRKMICLWCNVFGKIQVICNNCKKEYCNDCWHLFEVKDFGYVEHKKKNAYISNYCGKCMRKPGVDDSVKCEDVPKTGFNENGEFFDEMVDRVVQNKQI